MSKRLKLKKGALTAYIRRNWGTKGFDNKGRIKKEVLSSIIKRNPTPKGNIPNKKTKKRAVFAKTTKKWGK